jgi:hypothetical protein
VAFVGNLYGNDDSSMFGYSLGKFASRWLAMSRGLELLGRRLSKKLKGDSRIQNHAISHIPLYPHYCKPSGSLIKLKSLTWLKS